MNTRERTHAARERERDAVISNACNIFFSSEGVNFRSSMLQLYNLHT